MLTLFGVTTEMPEILKYIEYIQDKKKKLLDTTESIILKEERLSKVNNKRETKLEELEKWKSDFNKLFGHDPDDDEKISSRPYQLLFLGFTEAENKIEAMNNDIENSYNELKDLVTETNDVIDQLYELTYDKQEHVNVDYYLDIIESRKTQ
jgi:peptidoglycan hydrolase CwlO-like protein